MDKFAQHIDKLIHKVLNEAAEEKATEVSEKLHGGQKKIDKNKNGKIDSEDFKLLRKKKDMKEQPNEGSYVVGSDGKPRNMKPNEKLSAFSLEDFEDDFDEDELDVDFDEFDPRDKSWEEIKAHTGSPDHSEIDEQEMEDPKDGELDEWFYFHSKDGDESTPGDFEDDEDNMRKRYKMMDEPYSDDGDYSGMRNVMRKRYNKDMGISDDEDFAKSNKEEMDEWFYWPSKDGDESTPGDYEGDEKEEEEAEELSAQEPTYVGKGLSDNKPRKMFGSFHDEHGWFDDTDRQFKGDFDFEYDEEEFEDFPSMYEKYGKNQKWFAPGKEGQRYFDIYKEKFGSPFKVRTRKGDMGEQETEEGKMFGSFSDEHGWYDEGDRQHKGEFDFDYDEEEFEDFPSMYDKIGKNQKWFAPGKEGQRYFDIYKEKFGPFKVRTRKGDMGEQETEEGNAFTGALAKAKEDGDSSFNVDGKKYSVKEAKEIKRRILAKTKSGKKLSIAESKLLKQVNLSIALNESKKSSLILTEDELIDMIERIVNEQEKENKVKGNIKVEKAKGTVETDRVLKADKGENDDYLKLVTKKMKDYLKDGSKGEYNANPEFFPKGNGQLAKMAKKAYEPTEDVEEYIEDFAYGGGMENLDYDEIKPNEEWMEKTIEGSSKTGNSQDYANAEKTEFGKKLNAKRKRNAFSQEKKQSYKKSNQPTTKGEESKVEKKSDKMFAKLESTEDKKTKLVNEQMDKMKNLISYSRKTQ